MAGTKLIPEKITSPFQLMAAWFSMLVLLVSILLAAAANITNPEWAAGYLVGFTSLLIVLVLACVTLMLTVFRPHLQDGKEYAQWLKDKNSYASEGKRNGQPAASVRIQRSPKKALTQNIVQKSFEIDITNAPGAKDLSDALAKENFSPEIYKGPSGDDVIKNLERQESIWVGCAIPAKEAIKSIKIAISFWAHLKYMHLSNDGEPPPDEVHYQMYLGGASSTAEEYGLSPWSNEELLKLNEDMSQEEFHRVIRSKYPKSL